GILLPLGPEHKKDRDTMIASIGPFWDANETWLVLAVGLLLIAFPSAHSLVLKELYLPATIMLLGLILRGVSFDFRAKAKSHYRHHWHSAFKMGSLITALAQGYMLGQYVMGFEQSWQAEGFAVLSALGVTAAYSFIGGAWLILKCEGELQYRATQWTRLAGAIAAVGIALVSVVNVSISPTVYQKWLGFPQGLLLIPMPILCAGLFFVVDQYLRHAPHKEDFGCWIPFTAAITIFFICFQGLAYSFYPYVIPGTLTVWEAASATESLRFILVGALIAVPAIMGYTAFSYWVFRDKTSELKYY
ncbi:cytochrome d ubiquinol oxidase subunit II, partial [Marinibactrum halimedae]|uniref:cytochrome d ubiquinol oxidase subunit II n=2 Tax=Marinibactrum halimedae TaxID=1444977 RepID=UPI001E51248E